MRPRASRSASRSTKVNGGRRVSEPERHSGRRARTIASRARPRPRCRHGHERPGVTGGGVPSSPIHGFARDVRVEVGAVERAVDAERLTELGRATAQRGHAVDAAPRRPHLRDPGERRERPQQHRGAFALVAADRVRAPVHAVGEVHVQVAAGTEHRGVASCRSPVGMAGRVEARPGTPRPRRCGPGGRAAHEHLVEEVGGDDRASRR